MKHKRLSILSGTFLLTAGGLFAQLLGFFYQVGLSQLIGAETLGLYQLIMPVYSLLYAVTVMGLTISVSTLSARAYALGDQEGARRVLRRCVTAFLFLIIPLGIAGIASSEIISTQFLGNIRTRLGVILLVPCILLTGLEDLNKYCFYGIGRIGVPAACEALEQIIRIAAVLGFLIWIVPQSPENALGVIVGGMMICELFSVVFLWVALRKQFRKARPSSGKAEITWRQIFTIAIPISASSIITTLMSSVNYILIPQKLIESGMGISAAMASFGVLCGMTIPMLMLPTGFVNALGLTVVPDLAQKAALGREKEIRLQLSKALSSISVIIAPIMALLVVTGPAVGRLMFHNDQVGEYILPIAVGTMFYCWHLILSGALNTLGQQRTAARNQIICYGVQIAFTWFAIPQYALAGYAAGFLCMQALNFFLDFIAMRRALDWQPKLLQALTPIFSAAILTALLINPVFHLLSDRSSSVLPAFVFCLSLGFILYLLTLRIQGIQLKTLIQQRGLK